MTDENEDYNERVPYAHRMALISDRYYEVVSFPLFIYRVS